MKIGKLQINMDLLKSKKFIITTACIASLCMIAIPIVSKADCEGDKSSNSSVQIAVNIKIDFGPIHANKCESSSVVRLKPIQHNIEKYLLQKNGSNSI